MAVAAWIFVIKCAPGGGYRDDGCQPPSPTRRLFSATITKKSSMFPVLTEKPELMEFRQPVVTLILWGKLCMTKVMRNICK